MAEILRWSGDGLSAGNLTTSSAGTGDTAPAAILGAQAPTIVATGTRSPQIQFLANPATDQSAARWNFSALTTIGYRFYFTTGSTLPVSGQIPWIFGLYTGTTMHMEIDYTSTGRINLRDSVALIGQTAASSITTSTRYRIEGTVNHTTGAMTLSLFLGENTTAIATISGTGTGLTASSTNVNVGKLNTATSPAFQIDDLIVLDVATLPGPWAPIVTSTSALYRWVGFEYVPVDAYIWNGTAYAPIDLANP